jgi:hypothetical protein
MLGVRFSSRVACNSKKEVIVSVPLVLTYLMLSVLLLLKWLYDFFS